MKELAKYIAQSLVDHPDDVIVQEFQHGTSVTLTLQVAREDMGRIIGRNGRVINALRSLLRVAAERNGFQVNLEVVEP